MLPLAPLAPPWNNNVQYETKNMKMCIQSIMMVKRRLPASCIQEFNVILEKRSLSTKYIISISIVNREGKS